VKGALKTMKGDRVALVAYAGSAAMLCPLTHDLESFRSFLDGIGPFTATGAGSSLGNGLEQAVNLFHDGPHGGDAPSPRNRAPRRPRAVVVLSDGEEVDPGSSAVEAAREATHQGITVHAVMLGSLEGAKIPLPSGAGFVKDPQGREVISRPDPGLLDRVAEEGDGAFLAAWETAFPLELLYREHLSTVDRGVQRLEGSGAADTAYQGFALAALALLLFDLLLPRRKALRAVGLSCLLLLQNGSLFGAPGPEEDAFQQGVFLFQKGEYASALLSFEAAAPSGERGPDLLLNLGVTHLKLGHLDRAGTCFEEVLTTGKGETLKAARFGAGLVAFQQAEKILASEEAGNEVLTWVEKAKMRFTQCLLEGAWPREAAVNLELSNRLEQEAFNEMKGEKGGDDGTGRTEESGLEGAKGSGTERVVGGGEGSERGEDASRTFDDQGGSSGRWAAETPVRQQRIFALLRMLEQKRHALEEALRREARKSEGGRDW
jgi:tetratricopeptide (TPR) repeat protein